jgi:hypothetical protein
VTAENAATAKQIMAKLTGMTPACICGAYSEAAAIETEIQRDAAANADDLGSTTAQKMYLGPVDPKVVEARLRATPEMQRRIAAASGIYAIKYRLDKTYAKVTIRWTELTPASLADGKAQGERVLGQSAGAAVRTAAPATARTKLAALKPGEYRVTLEGEAGGKKVTVDERAFWFDGVRFEEL